MESSPGLKQLATHGLWLVCFVCGSMAPAQYVPAPDLPPATQAGDLIFRRGTQPVSAAVLLLDGGEFSHVGMLLGQPGAWQVLHSTPSEVPGRADGVVVDSLDFFLNPARSRGHAVYRVQASPGQHQRALQHALDEHGKPFLIADRAGTYCTLLVWDAWQQAGVDFSVPFTRLNVPMLQGDYLLPGQLRRSRQLQRLE